MATQVQELFVVGPDGVRPMPQSRTTIRKYVSNLPERVAFVRLNSRKVISHFPGLKAAGVVSHSFERVIAGNAPDADELRPLIEALMATGSPARVVPRLPEANVAAIVKRLSEPLTEKAAEILVFDPGRDGLRSLAVPSSSLGLSTRRRASTVPASAGEPVDALPGLAPWQQRFLGEFPSLRTEDFAAKLGSTASNRHAAASRLERDGKILGLAVGRNTLYPEFQLRHQKPRAVVAEIIAAFRARDGRDYNGWDVAHFLSTGSGYLRGARPVDLLDRSDRRDDLLSAVRGHLKTAYDL